MDSWLEWKTVIPPLVGAAAGFLVTIALRWFDRKRTIKSHWQAIRAEMTLCSEKAITLQDDQIP